MSGTCLHSNTLTETESRYYLKRADLEQFLIRQYGEGWDFEIKHSNYRWKFKTPEQLDTGLIREWINELQEQRRPADSSVW